MIMPTAPITGNVGVPSKIEALLWEPKGVAAGSVPRKDTDWACHPVEPSLIPLQKLAGIKQGDSSDNFVITLHFVLCPDLNGLALNNATVGATNRDSRYARFMDDPLTEADLVRHGLRAPTLLPALQQGVAEGGPTESGDAAADAEKPDKSKESEQK